MKFLLVRTARKGALLSTVKLHLIIFYIEIKILRAGWSTIRRNEDVNVKRFKEIVVCRPQIGLLDDMILQ